MSALFDLSHLGRGLTFASVLPELGRSLAPLPDGAAPALVVQAPPGTGKTTLVPPAVANAVALAAGAAPGPATGGDRARNRSAHEARVIVTQPRRVAARSTARRLASLDGSPLGERVGYAVRGERKAGPGTLIEFVTPGLLLRRLLADPELSGVAAVVVDEVHERQLDTDLLLGLLGEVRELREDLTLVAMSATLDAPRFASLLGTESSPAPLVDSPSALFPLTVSWAPAAGPRQDSRGVTREFLDHVARTAAEAHARTLATSPEADALVFLPGAREVSRVAETLARLAPHAEVLQLHGQVPPREQDRAVSGREPGGAPRLIVSTSLAESSLTVPGVRLVIDAGLSREPRRDAARGMSGLVTVAASRASAEQRAGRAARLGPGEVVRCYDERTFAAAPANVTPEMLTADLTAAALDLAVWGTPRGEGLRLPDAPLAPALDDAEATLRSLGAIGPDGRATPAGEALASMPVDPRWGRALVDASRMAAASSPNGAARERALADVALAVAVATGDVRADGGDLDRAVGQARNGSLRGVEAVRREAKRLGRLAADALGERGASRASAPERPTAVGHSGAPGVGEIVALAWPERVARRAAPGVYLLASGTRAGLPEGSPLAAHEWLAIAEVQRAEGHAAAGTGAVIRAAAALDEEAALEVAAPLLRDEVVARFESGRVQARRVRALGAIELASTPVKPTPEDGARAVADALREQGLGTLHFTEGAEALRRRLAFLHLHLGEPWPDVSDAALLARLDDWLGPELERIGAGTPAAKVDLHDPLRRLLPWPEAARLDELAPQRLAVPSGNTAAIEYPAVGEDSQPVVAVKLQECFGWADTPRLADGRAPVLFHLLSPGRKPLAVTSDLASFWSGPYAQVRSEMRGRYPKHPWPEDPWSAQATHLTKRRLEGR
ncbi:ATP-dependent helicase HrpB [Galactobacter valiniphilus]|uniref:ATP-dependent helicase HrpB n=1 Tax=Galactobacter valiniphilus TaxID=2676122 RepID=A0A399J6L3_9MICC|nr:ATP-dependent helicase HrpB [Galactobacter valiniphilus]RII41091.1 ATP-dependent helicase HrpB [Galactobacter valiniphilus]